ncbi:MAG: hypothetical protein ABGW90_15335 [Martelella sp.]
MAVAVDIISDPSGLFGVDGATLVAAAAATPGIYPVTLGITHDGRTYEVSQPITLSADSFAFAEQYLAETTGGARIAPSVVLDFSADRYALIGD